MARTINFIERIRAATRAFVLGQAVVEPFDKAWGHDTSEFSPTEYGSYIAKSSLVYSVVTLRADLFVDLPLKIYSDAGRKIERVGGPLYDILHTINPFWTLRRLLKMTAYSLDLWGQAFWFCERGTSGRQPPSEIWWGRPDNVRIVPDEANYISEFLYFPTGGGEPLHFAPNEVVWFRNPNPVDEFSPLSPLAAARLGADLHNSALQSNNKLFQQGMQIGGFVFPPKGTTWTVEQAKQAEEAMTQRFTGAGKAHRWAFFRQEYQINQAGTSPKDAEFVETLNLTLEEVARAYRIPLDLLGGQRTYANVEASERGVYQRSILPLSGDIASELNEQFVPMFPGSKDFIEFDTSGVTSLQEHESEKWTREQGKLQEGAITINEWREEQGLLPVEWGNVPKWLSQQQAASLALAGPIEETPEEDAPGEDMPMPADDMPMDDKMPRGMTRDIRTPYGSDVHRQIWGRFMGRSAKQEKKIAEVTAELFRRQKDSILAGLKRSARSVEDPFSKAEWRRKFREAIRPVLKEIVQEAGDEALSDLGLALKFKLVNPSVRRFLERRAQRFAEQVNETTWTMLKTGLSDLIEKGGGLMDQMKLVDEIMAERIRSSAEVIARTETIGALNGGTNEAWKQSEVVEGKEWIATLDDRVRDAHQEAHGQVVGLDESFDVGGEQLEFPGADGGSAENVINCRCTTAAVVKEL
jgi:HK97 family phage portal protein